MTFRLEPTTTVKRRRGPFIHMEDGWGPEGPFTKCGRDPAKPPTDGTHVQTMTTDWGEVTCRGCLRVKR